ncbi:MAG: sigma-70 family RNA polymerase sigma factor [Bacteroidota bacterium]
MIDHLFRHQYGKMISVLIRIFGLSHLETIEDAVQDTFALAMVKWRDQVPDKPEAWLMKAAKNRAIDLLRKIKADHNRLQKLDSGPSVMTLDNLFLEHEIEDSQLRMIFTACHPGLHPKDQITFALRTIAGFSTKEIASALLLKNETIKKRLARARKAIREKGILFRLPHASELRTRLERVHEVLYLIFNEGFHSNHKELLIRKDLCGEAIRLTQMVLKKKELRTGSGYALFGLMCFHASRLESKVSETFESISLKHQDRSKWFRPLIQLGHDSMNKSMEYSDHSVYHIEAAIAVQHLRARSFETTDWEKILKLYNQLYTFQKDPLILLNIAIVLIQLEQNDQALALLDQINPADLEQRAYLYYGVKSEYYQNIGHIQQAISYLDQALENVSNSVEKQYILKKRTLLSGTLN